MISDVSPSNSERLLRSSTSDNRITARKSYRDTPESDDGKDHETPKKRRKKSVKDSSFARKASSASTTSNLRVLSNKQTPLKIQTRKREDDDDNSFENDDSNLNGRASYRSNVRVLTNNASITTSRRVTENRENDETQSFCFIL